MNYVIQCCFFVACICLSVAVLAQVPAQFNFQGVARNHTGQPILGKDIALRFTVRTGSMDGYISYSEERSVKTDNNGVFNAIIGGEGARSQSGRFDTVLWHMGPKFLQAAIDTANGFNYVELGATQMLSVPYALYSINSSNSGYSNSSGSHFFLVTLEQKDISFPGIESESRVWHTVNFTESVYSSNNLEVPVYDTAKGELITPTSGIYQFDVHLNNGDIGIFRNNVLIRESDDLIGLRLSLLAGDIIQIKVWGYHNDNRNETIEYESDKGSIQNYFSGYRIH